MKGFELTNAIRDEAARQGVLGAEIKAIDEEGTVYKFLGVEHEVVPTKGDNDTRWGDGNDHILWVKIEATDG